MELREYLGIIRKWWWLIVLCTVLAAGASLMVSRSTPPTYQASTTLMVGQFIQEPDPNTQDMSTSERLAQTYAEMVRRQPILQATVEALDLDMNWKALRERISVNLVRNTQLMEIQVTDTDPQWAMLTANEIARQLILQSPTQPDKEREAHRQFVTAQLADLQAKISAGQAEVAELEKSLATAFNAEQMQSIRGQITALQTQVNTWQANYASLLSFLQEGVTNYISVVEPATAPAAPISPRTRTNVLLAAVVGVILGVGFAFLIEYLDDTIKSPDDIVQALGLSPLGAISRINGKSYEDKLVAAIHPRSPISEAYRILRTNIQFSAVDKPLETLLVSSPNPIEGKSITLANLGVVVAQAGLSVILVDSDLRRPVLHKIFDLPNKKGLTSVLLDGEPSLDGRLQATQVENLRVLTSGPLPPNPSELLGSQKMKSLIESLKGKADVVLLDSPPALVVTDAAVLAGQVDGVLLVADAGKTRREMAQRAKEDLIKVGANVLGAVLNKL
ncbi:MAG: polysaccharide biosynthesis tyrosine autokinase, partial [Anaerolineae bacterium]|nr:polysaccharide biosynthesis tyrosine autokinase [Anaerolineae bacterium]